MGIFGVVLLTLTLGVSFLFYGFSILNPADPLVGMAFTIMGIFLVLAALLIMFTQLFMGSPTIVK